MKAKKLFHYFLRIIAGVLIALILIYAALYIFQGNLIFYPRPITEEILNNIRKEYKNAEEINIKTSDNINLHGWLVKNSSSGKCPLIIYFGGNAEEVSHLVSDARNIKNWSLAAMNYRGYGLSQGKPGEKELFEDALNIYDYFSKRQDVDNTRMVVMGRSLGSGVAIYLAQQRSAKGIILVSPYDSIVSVAQEQFPFAPVSLILRHRFDSLSRAPLIKIPLLAFIGTADKTVLPWHSKRLIEKWGGHYTVKIIDKESHNTIINCEEYWKGINEFLSAF
jgi:pimeloyl-ACP methyl ester carboxylesterase